MPEHFRAPKVTYGYTLRGGCAAAWVAGWCHFGRPSRVGAHRLCVRIGCCCRRSHLHGGAATVSLIGLHNAAGPIPPLHPHKAPPHPKARSGAASSATV